MYDQVVKCQRAGLCLSEHFLIVTVFQKFPQTPTESTMTQVIHSKAEKSNLTSRMQQ